MLQIAYGTHPGTSLVNQDWFYVNEKAGVFAVIDGCGGCEDNSLDASVIGVGTLKPFLVSTSRKIFSIPRSWKRPVSCFGCVIKKICDPMSFKVTMTQKDSSRLGIISPSID